MTTEPLFPREWLPRLSALTREPDPRLTTHRSAVLAGCYGTWWRCDLGLTSTSTWALSLTTGGYHIIDDLVRGVGMNRPSYLKNDRTVTAFSSKSKVCSGETHMQSSHQSQSCVTFTSDEQEVRIVSSASWHVNGIVFVNLSITHVPSVTIPRAEIRYPAS